MREITPLLRVLALLFATNTFAQNPVERPAPTVTPQPETCTVQGQVVSAATGEPLKAARVVLIDRAHTEPPEAMTDSKGHFVITGVPAGAYHFRANKLGYVEQAYHPDASGPAQLLTLAPGDKVDKILFRLSRAAVIAGRITDETGEPVVSVQVTALVPQTIMDYGVTSPTGMDPFQIALTNDLGEYRLYNLPPGSYYLAASDTVVRIGPMGGETPKRGLDWAMGLFSVHPGDHPLLYYPGVFKPSEAQKIRLIAGQEARIDLSLRPVKMLTVSGRVFDPNGKPAPYAAVGLMSQAGLTDGPGEKLACRTDAHGNFEIKSVLPGSYMSSASLDIDQERGIKRYWTEQPVEAAGDDVLGLQLRLSGDLELSGKVITDGGAKLDFRGVWVSLDGTNVPSPGGGEMSGGRSGEVTQDGMFTMANVAQTTYHLRLSGLPDNWYVRSAVFGSQNVLDNGLKLSGESAGHPLEITVSPGVAQVEGVVLRGDHRVPGAKVKLVPDPANPFRPDRPDTAWADENGQFVIKNVAPGSYRVLAADIENDADDYYDDSPASTTINLSEKESKTVQIRLDKRRE